MHLRMLYACGPDLYFHSFLLVNYEKGFALDIFTHFRCTAEKIPVKIMFRNEVNNVQENRLRLFLNMLVTLFKTVVDFPVITLPESRY